MNARKAARWRERELERAAVVAVVSDHALLAPQRLDLERRGYDTFVQVVPPSARREFDGTRFVSAKEVYECAVAACGCRPSLIVAVMPPRLRGTLAALVARDGVKVWRAVMRQDEGAARWAGAWVEVCGVEVVEIEGDVIRALSTGMEGGAA